MIRLIIIFLLIISILITIVLLNQKESFYVQKFDKIPKVIYKSGKESNLDLSPDVKILFEKTLKKNPGFTIKYFSDEECKRFLEENYGRAVNKAYKKLKPGSYKADLFRYCILYRNGGIWSDLTDEFMVPIEDFVDFYNDSLVLAKDKVYRGEKGIQIGFIACKPKNPILLTAINKVVENVNNNYYGANTLSVTGPNLFYNILNGKKNYKLDIDFDGHYYFDIKTKKKLIKYKSLKPIINKILKRNKKEYYVSLWTNKDIYNN